MSLEPNAVQRHRNTILECLRDPDISIRRRALDLSFALINAENVRPLIRELLAFLEIADTEFKLAMTSQICIAADRYAPNKRWHVDTVLRVLKLAGGYVREEILSSFIRLVGLTPELQMYTTQKLYASLKEDITQEGLTVAAVWCIGEYGDQLLKGGNYEEEELVKEVPPPKGASLISGQRKRYRRLTRFNPNVNLYHPYNLRIPPQRTHQTHDSLPTNLPNQPRPYHPLAKHKQPQRRNPTTSRRIRKSLPIRRYPQGRRGTDARSRNPLR